MAIIAFIAVGLVTNFLAGCAPTNQIVPRANSGPITFGNARIKMVRPIGSHAYGVAINISDGGTNIGNIGFDGILMWDRPAGSMILKANIPTLPESKQGKPFQICVGSGMTYKLRVYFPNSQNHWNPTIELESGTPITCEQSVTTSAGKVEQVQQPFVPTTAAQTTSKAIEELQTFTGEIKIIEVRHFTQSESLGLSQEFINSFYDNLRERLAKNNVAGQIVDEGSAVPDAVAANTLIVEGKFTEYKKGGFLEGVGMVGSEIKFYRKSDHALIKIITPRVAFKPSPFNSDNGVGKVTGYSTAYEIKKALK